MRSPLQGCDSDGRAADQSHRAWRPPRNRQTPGQDGPDAANPLLAVPQAHPVRARQVSILRVSVRREHRRCVRSRAFAHGSQDVRATPRARFEDTQPVADRRGPAAGPRRLRDAAGEPPSGEGGLPPPLPMSILRTVCLGTGAGMRVWRSIRSRPVRDSRVSRVRFSCPWGRRGVSRLRRPVRRGPS